jgi:hypothetical protein
MFVEAMHLATQLPYHFVTSGEYGASGRWVLDNVNIGSAEAIE